MPSTYAMETQDLVKHFGDVRAVDGVNLRVPTGNVLGLLGPNGAGSCAPLPRCRLTRARGFCWGRGARERA